MIPAAQACPALLVNGGAAIAVHALANAGSAQAWHTARDAVVRPNTPRAIDGIPQHDQHLRHDIVCVDCAGGEWTLEVQHDPDCGDIVHSVKLGGRWWHVVEVLNDLITNSLYDALQRRAEQERHQAEEDRAERIAEAGAA